ncbi:uncharacterized protein LOC142178328 [Nicotiana tabacum]|uniref:Uncharacterized protein LOC142178328 n=1 Tax=Nicotiana tabacum TaxID=4097 RepID=A0AC58U2Q6_TOBAC
MISTIIWNDRGIRSSGAIERLKKLKQIHKLSFIALLEPFRDNLHIDFYLNYFRIQLSMNQATANINNKIWLFWDQDFTGTLLDQDEQQITIELKHVELGETIHLTIVYAKCKPTLRSPLWENLRHKSTIYLGFYGPRYTWSNGRGPCSIVWKRLDKDLANDNWLSSFPTTTITHLASTGSDHSPLPLEMNVRQKSFKKYFRFLNYWVKNESFMSLVQKVWNNPIN